jgi:hypothetical protein
MNLSDLLEHDHIVTVNLRLQVTTWLGQDYERAPCRMHTCCTGDTSALCCLQGYAYQYSTAVRRRRSPCIRSCYNSHYCSSHDALDHAVSQCKRSSIELTALHVVSTHALGLHNVCSCCSTHMVVPLCTEIYHDSVFPRSNESECSRLS